jgi:site-specific DNA-methyltransferase (adenine-specific)
MKIEEIKNTVICSDCLEVMRQLPDKCIDLVLTDPPYGIGEARRKNESRGKLAVSKAYPIESWDDTRPSREVFNEIVRVSKNQIIFGGNYFADFLPASSCWLVWDKENGESDFADCELAWTSFKSAVRKFKWKWQGMLQEDMAKKEIRVHRNQKPTALMEWCLNKYSKSGDIVLDCFLGSGTTAVACKRTGRDFIGIEISPAYCEIARARILQAETGVTVKEMKAGQIPLWQ